MSFESWVKNSWLERLQSDAPEIARLLALADGRLADYGKAVTAKLSPDVQLGLAYDVIRVCGTSNFSVRMFPRRFARWVVLG